MDDRGQGQGQGGHGPEEVALMQCSKHPIGLNLEGMEAQHNPSPPSPQANRPQATSFLGPRVPQRKSCSLLSLTPQHSVHSSPTTPKLVTYDSSVPFPSCQFLAPALPPPPETLEGSRVAESVVSCSELTGPQIQ